MSSIKLLFIRHNNRGGFRLQDDPGFQFCLDEPQIIESLRERSVFELSVSEKLKVLLTNVLHKSYCQSTCA